MSAQCETTAKRSAGAGMGFFERYLTLWVFLCIVAGIGLGRLFPPAFQAIGGLEIARINLPVAALIWLMIFPMLLKVDFAVLHRVTAHWKGIGVTLFVNWGVKPFSMALLGWLFIGWLFRPWLPAEQINSYIAGLILLAAAPCTAMVFVWSHLTRGEPNFTLTQVALNDIDHGVRLRADRRACCWACPPSPCRGTRCCCRSRSTSSRRWQPRSSVRRAILRHETGLARLAQTIKVLHPVSLTALLATLVLLFGFQGEQIVRQPLVIAAAGGADPDSGVLQLRAGVFPQPRAGARRTASPVRRR